MFSEPSKVFAPDFHPPFVIHSLPKYIYSLYHSTRGHHFYSRILTIGESRYR
jgi:hypothetical protein